MGTIKIMIVGAICALMMTGCGMGGNNANNSATARPEATAKTDSMTDKAGNAVKDAADNVGDAAGDVVDGAGNVVEDAGKTVNDAADSVSGKKN